MGKDKLELLAKIKPLLLIFLISLPLAGCSVFNDDDYIDDKPFTQQENWENQGMSIPY